MLQATQGSHFGGSELGLPQINSPRGGNDYGGELGSTLGPQNDAIVRSLI